MNLLCIWPRCFSSCSVLGLGLSEFVWEPFKNRVCFPHPSGSPGHKICWFTKPNVIGTCLFHASLPNWGVLCGAWMPQFSGRTSGCNIARAYELLYQVLNRPHLWPSYTSWYDIFFISLVVENLFCYTQAILRGSCSMYSCGFGVSLEGGELRWTQDVRWNLTSWSGISSSNVFSEEH